MEQVTKHAVRAEPPYPSLPFSLMNNNSNHFAGHRPEYNNPNIFAHPPQTAPPGDLGMASVPFGYGYNNQNNQARSFSFSTTNSFDQQSQFNPSISLGDTFIPAGNIPSRSPSIYSDSSYMTHLENDGESRPSTAASFNSTYSHNPGHQQQRRLDSSHGDAHLLPAEYNHMKPGNRSHPYYGSKASHQASHSNSQKEQHLRRLEKDLSFKRARTTPHQKAILEQQFLLDNHPNNKFRHALAQDLKMPERQLAIWFQNRRAKAKADNIRQSAEAIVRSAQESVVHVQAYSPDLIGLTLQENVPLAILPVSELEIDTWKRCDDGVGTSCNHSLLAYYITSRRTLNYFIACEGNNFRITIDFSSISNIVIKSQGDVGVLIISVTSPPTFYLQAQKNDSRSTEPLGQVWHQITDFSECQSASKAMQHHLFGPSSALHNAVQTLTSSDVYLQNIYNSQQTINSFSYDGLSSPNSQPKHSDETIGADHITLPVARPHTSWQIPSALTKLENFRPSTSINEFDDLKTPTSYMFNKNNAF